MAFRQRSLGSEGVRTPYFSRMEVWSVSNAACVVASESWFLLTVMSTMEPEEIDAGRRMDGNSICSVFSKSFCER